MSVFDADLLQAYRETHYIVRTEAPFTLQIGVPSLPLRALHSALSVDASAFVTACNPFSTDVGMAANAKRHAELGAELARRGLAHVEGVGQHPANRWPGEESYLVLGITLAAARVLGENLDQNAIVWSGADAVPQLILLR